MKRALFVGVAALFLVAGSCKRPVEKSGGRPNHDMHSVQGLEAVIKTPLTAPEAEAALNSHGTSLLSLGAPSDQCVVVAAEIEKALNRNALSIAWKVSLSATRLNLLRQAKSDQLAVAIQPSKVVFEQLLSDQANIAEQLGIQSSSAFFDDAACLASALVLAQLDTGDVPGAFQTVQRAKWTSFTSRFGSPPSLSALQKRLAKDHALLVEQYFTPEALLTFKDRSPMASAFFWASAQMFLK